MTIEEALVSKLTADGTLAALVGAKVYPQQAPQSDALPYVLYATSEAEQTMSCNGYINLFVAFFRFDCYAAGYSSAKAVAAAVRGCLFGFLSGNVGGTGPGSINVQGIWDNGGEDTLDPPVNAAEHGTDCVSVQVRVWFRLN